MNSETFVNALYEVVYTAAIADVLQVLSRPPGRSPRVDMLDLSSWFNDLPQEDQQHVAGIVRLSVDHAVFGVMAVLDGVRTLDRAHTELYLRTGDGTLLNERHDLHDILRSAADRSSRQ